MESLNSDLLTTDEAAKIGGVGPSSIKRWADSGQLPCVKTPGGHRRFSRVAIEAFFKIESDQTLLSPDPEPQGFQTVMKAARHEVDAELLGIRARAGSWYAAADEIGQILRHIGVSWESGRISVAQEHRATDCLVRAIGRICDTLPMNSGGKTCILACPPGDDHTIGLHLAELCLREAGWDTLWLGRMTPTAEILKMIDLPTTAMVAISASSFSLGLSGLTQMVAELALPCRQRGIPLVVGGRGSSPLGQHDTLPLSSFNAFRQLLDRLG